MKRLATLVVLSLALTINLVFAATPTAEPSLPADIASYQVREFPSCTKHAGKLLGVREYIKNTETLLRRIMVATLNGQKIFQSEIDQTGFSPEQKSDGREFAFFVKNSPEKNWLKYELSEYNASFDRMLAEIGLTEEQLESCDE